jgi:SulP family sulfate permease
MWETTGFTRLLGPEHQFPDKRTAIATIFTKLDREICKRCTARVFWECQSVPGPDSAPDAGLGPKPPALAPPGASG